MPRPKLQKSKKLSEITFIKLLPQERKALDKIHKKRSRSRHPRRSRSAIMRLAFLFWLDYQVLATHWEEDNEGKRA